MEDSIKAIQIVVKTGWLFANCDGTYDDSEKQYINESINVLLASPEIVEESKVAPDYMGKVKDSLYELIDTKQSFDSVVTETNALLNSLSEEDHKKVRSTLLQFIKSLIEKDGNIATVEKNLLKKWESMVK